MREGEELLEKLDAFEQAAQAAVAFMQDVARELEADGVSPLWTAALQDAAPDLPDNPYGRMWNNLTEARDFAIAHGFREVASIIIPGIVRDSAVANIIQRAHDNGQQRIREGVDPEIALADSMVNHYKAQVDLCVEKVLEARRAKDALKNVACKKTTRPSGTGN